MTLLLIVFGIMFIFELVCVPAVFLHASLTVTTVIAIILSVLYSIIVTDLIKKKNIETKEGRIFHAEGDSVKYAVFACVLIAVQIIMVVVVTHRDDDDAFYLGTATTAYETDSMFVYSPYTGKEVGVISTDNKDYILSPLPIMWASLGRITHISPTILAHTIMPPFMLFFAYLIQRLLGMRLFKGKENEERNAWIYLSVVSVLIMFGNYSTKTPATFLLHRIWQGKAILAGMIIPALFYWFLRICDKEKDNKIDHIGLFLTSAAACLASFSSVVTVPVLIVLFALGITFIKKDVKKGLLLIPAMIPEIVLAIIYLGIR